MFEVKYNEAIKALGLDEVNNLNKVADKLRMIACLANEFPIFLELLANILGKIENKEAAKELASILCGPNGLNPEAIKLLNEKLAAFDNTKLEADIVRTVDGSALSDLRKMLTVLGITTDPLSNRFNLDNLSKFFILIIMICLCGKPDTNKKLYLSDQVENELTLLAKGYLANTKFMVDFFALVPPNIVEQCSVAYKILTKQTFVAQNAQPETWQYSIYGMFISMSLMQLYITTFVKLNKDIFDKIGNNKKDNIKRLEKRFFEHDAELAEGLGKLLDNQVFSQALEVATKNNADIYNVSELRSKLEALSSKIHGFKDEFRALLKDPKFRKSIEALTQTTEFFLNPRPEIILAYMLFSVRYENLSQQDLENALKEDVSQQTTGIYGLMLKAISLTLAQPTMSTASAIGTTVSVNTSINNNFRDRMTMLGVELVYESGERFPDVFLKILRYLAGIETPPALLPEIMQAIITANISKRSDQKILDQLKQEREAKQAEKDYKRIAKENEKLKKESVKIWRQLLGSSAREDKDMLVAELFLALCTKNKSAVKDFFKKQSLQTIQQVLADTNFYQGSPLKYAADQKYIDGIKVILKFYIDYNLNIKDELQQHLALLASQLSDKKIPKLLMQLNSNVNSEKSHQLIKSSSVHSFDEKPTESKVAALVGMFNGSNKKNKSGSSTSSSSSTPPGATPSGVSPPLSRKNSEASLVAPPSVEQQSSTPPVKRVVIS